MHDSAGRHEKYAHKWASDSYTHSKQRDSEFFLNKNLEQGSLIDTIIIQKNHMTY